MQSFFYLLTKMLHQLLSAYVSSQSLGFEGIELRFGKGFPAGVRTQSIQYARQMLEMKTGGSYLRRPLPESNRWKVVHQFLKFFPGLKQGMSHGLQQIGHIR